MGIWLLLKGISGDRLSLQGSHLSTKCAHLGTQVIRPDIRRIDGTTRSLGQNPTRSLSGLIRCIGVNFIQCHRQSNRNQCKRGQSQLNCGSSVFRVGAEHRIIEDGNVHLIFLGAGTRAGAALFRLGCALLQSQYIRHRIAKCSGSHHQRNWNESCRGQCSDPKCFQIQI